MMELTIYGRGGQGGVTLAKLIATAFYLRGKNVQAFGVYAAERSGAPLQAYVRIDDEEITNHNQIREPDHVVVLDRTLIGPGILAGLKSEGWLILNTPQPPESFADVFPGRRVATVDATSIAVENGLGTRTVPIVNTTMLGAVARAFDLGIEDIRAALAEAKFKGGNVTAAARAQEVTQLKTLPGRPAASSPAAARMPVASILDDAVGGSPRIKTGSWANRRPQRQSLTPPCNHGCPAGNDVQAFVQAMGRSHYNEALGILLESTPLPGVCGRVCPAPCMDHCNRAQFDEAVNIRELERSAAAHGARAEPTAPWRDFKVAVVGSGPAGLSAAYHLARLGYPVTLIEAEKELGGVLRTGIPAYRLPRDVLNEEIGYILRHGVALRLGKRLSRDELLGLTHEYAAVFSATGLQSSRSLDLGEDGQGIVWQGIAFLDRVRHTTEHLDGKRVVVIGGGNTAMDAARTARRLGARSVHVLYRRTRAEMPAIREEIEEALAEGIVLEELVSPLHLKRLDAGALLTCQRMMLGEPDESGRRRPVPATSEDSQFDVSCDRVILALGQGADFSILPEGSEVHEDGAMLGLTGAPIFAGGDFATNEGTVAAAIGSGRRAAWHIHRTLTGEDLFPPPPAPVATPEVITTHVFSHAPRQHGMELPAAMRRHGFEEVRRGFLEEPGHHPAALEAARCFSCGVCNSCDRCVQHCPEGILCRNGDGYRFDYDYCKGCGVCAAQCPRGVIFMSDL